MSFSSHIGQEVFSRLHTMPAPDCRRLDGLLCQAKMPNFHWFPWRSVLARAENGFPDVGQLAYRDIIQWHIAYLKDRKKGLLSRQTRPVHAVFGCWCKACPRPCFHNPPLNCNTQLCAFATLRIAFAHCKSFSNIHVNGPPLWWCLYIRVPWRFQVNP